MDPLTQMLRLQTRRHFFQSCALGVGKVALASLLAEGALSAAPARNPNPLAPRRPHHLAKAKNVIYLFMAGGPSQLELFDCKPKLVELDGQPIPESYLRERRFAFMDSFARQPPRLLASRRRFARHGRCGTWMSELLPHTSTIVDDIAVVPTVATEVFNHGPAKLFVNTGSAQFGRPSMGAWVTYGLGSEARDLPGFVVLQSGPRGPRGGAPLWGSGFLPTAYQGVPFRTTGEPVLNLANPPGINGRRQGQALEVLRDLNGARLNETGDPEIATRIAQYEMAYRMQTSAPELIDLGREDRRTLEMYGAQPGRVTFANNCLLARRLVERGVRFVQLYHTDWDHHGGTGADLGSALQQVCREVDRGCAALVRDLKERGLLDETLVVWGGEFGRTPMGENRQTVGRNHHIDAYTMWLAGGGIKGGVTVGQTDELGFSPVADRVHVHDLQATILHLLGLDHLRLTVRFQGRDFRLTDVGGEIVQKLLA
ncbi:MAG: DUF1501 domain-containing protein [Gemmataceae bacterium]|nr:DUF1501 domain-containing protein [Gemmataceae bacterium]